jgi:CelD/BcsL family acetyltransferase involved in cellulose biosynthesis
MHQLEVVVVSDESVLVHHTSAWSDLLARSASDRPTLTSFWMLTWWRLFGQREGRQLVVLLVFDGERMVGLAPLSRRVRWHRRAVPFRRIELLATGEREADEIGSDYVGLIAERGYEQAVAEAVAKAIDRGEAGAWDEIVMTAMDGEVPTGRLLGTALAARGATLEESSTVPSPYIQLPARWEDYLAGLPRSGRYLVNRSLRDFDKWAGADATLERVSQAADIAEGQRILVLLHEQRWKAAGRDGVFASQVFSDFHAAVLPELFTRGALELAWLKVRGQPVAVVYNIVWNNKVLFYQGGRSLDVPKGVRPGIVLHARMIQAAIAAGRSEYDFLPGTSQYKLQLATASHPIVAFRATRAPMREGVRRVLEHGVSFLREQRKLWRQTSPQGPARLTEEGND